MAMQDCTPQLGIFQPALVSNSHPPYSPDLAPCDLFISKGKLLLKGIKFDTDDVKKKHCKPLSKPEYFDINLSWCELTPTHIFTCPEMAAALQKIDMDSEQQLYTPKIEDIATAVREMHGDI
ncbi:hypothetical protein LAZ67_6003601 [Cordylochernes scorpioides]|uniref:Uncharacterized protein n=1 Tax=Cordylochernes scorpioides TaxID=51811 RepID=A0ABY6KNV7_9ARAC|nr:hypothetical protein LAZ67_6003601 [Cordylochernes scorpioides]